MRQAVWVVEVKTSRGWHATTTVRALRDDARKVARQTEYRTGEVCRVMKYERMSRG